MSRAAAQRHDPEPRQAAALDECVSRSSGERQWRPDRRVDVIAGGAVIVRVFAEELHARAGIDELVVSEHDILDGIALGLA